MKLNPKETIKRLCILVNEVNTHFHYTYYGDCFCGDNLINNNTPQIDSELIDFIENVVKEKINSH